MEKMLLFGGSGVADASHGVSDRIEPVELDLVGSPLCDGSQYRAWEFDAADAAMVDELSY
jgi:hypothetical protein